MKSIMQEVCSLRRLLRALSLKVSFGISNPAATEGSSDDCDAFLSTRFGYIRQFPQRQRCHELVCLLLRQAGGLNRFSGESS